MPAGGMLTVKTGIVDMPAAWRAAKQNLKPGLLVRISVTDTGVGMPQEVKDKLFEPFFSTKEMGKGTGLGLSTVYGIVMQSGGEIEVESYPGRGTVFSIYLPLVSAAEAEKEDPQGRPVTGGRETILLVEDEESLLKLGRRVLESGGYTVLTASDGQEALKILSDRPGKVNLLVTDMVMPGMDGVELARRTFAAAPGVRILYMSGYTEEAVSVEYVTAANRAFIQKPFSPDSLLLKVRLVLDSSPEHARP